MKSKTLWLILLALGCSGCFHVFEFKSAIVGSGTLQKEVRNVADFQEIDLSGAGTVHYTVGDQVTCEVEIDDNLLEHIVTEVENGVLKIYNQEPIVTRRGLTVRITSSNLTGAAIRGAGTLHLRNLQASKFQADIAGSGDIYLQGQVGDVSASIMGSGNIDAFEVSGETADVSISGSGTVKLNASKKINARITGSGDVFYMGEPQINQTSMGSGSVKRRK